MSKFCKLQLFVILFIFVSAVKKHQKPSADVVENSKGKAVGEDFDAISLRKQLFQDIFMEHQKHNKLRFGYVCENPIQWEQRFEEKDLLANRHRGKVKWGSIDGNYGEHYWDINHK